MNSNAPRPGWCTACHVDRVIDGDTVEVVVVRRLRVRLLGCWAPESRTLDKAEKQRGLAAKASLAELVGDGRDARLFVPGHGDDLAECLTLGRVLGELWCGGKDVGAEQVRRGHATTTKQPREAEYED